MLRFALALAIALIAVSASAQTDPRSNTGGTPPEVKIPRPMGGLGESPRPVAHVGVGDRAPDFELQTASGATFRLKESRGGWVALFFTGGRDDLDQIATLARTLDSLRFRTIAVSTDHVRTLAAWLKDSGSRVTPLADERGDIAALYGLGQAERGTTAPQGVFLLDPQGRVRLVLLGQKVAPPSLVGLVQSAVEGL